MHQLTIKHRENRKHIVIIGGGFAGLNFTRELFRNSYYDVTLVDKNNYNYFTPLLYQVATSFLEPASISYPFRKFFKRRGIAFILASVLSADTESNELCISNGERLTYDYLVIATGSKTNFFGNRSIEQNAFALKGIDDALRLRDSLIRVLEQASHEDDPFEKERLLTVVIAGGGATGVELAGMLAEMKEHIQLEYPEMRYMVPHIYIVDAAPQLLSSMSDKTHRDAYNILKRLGVQIKLNRTVLQYENDQVLLSTGEVIEAKTMIWAAGVTANYLDGISKSSIGRGGRMITDHFNKVTGYENIYAIGDISIQYGDSAYPSGHPQVAQPAIQQGRRLAKNFIAIAEEKPMKPFKYFDRGDLAIIGRTAAVADLFKKKLHINGIVALLGWLFIHLISLVSYHNKIKTFYGWAVAYISKDQALRMIFRSEKNEEVIAPLEKRSRLTNLDINN